MCNNIEGNDLINEIRERVLPPGAYTAKFPTIQKEWEISREKDIFNYISEGYENKGVCRGLCIIYECQIL